MFRWRWTSSRTRAFRSQMLRFQSPHLEVSWWPLVIGKNGRSDLSPLIERFRKARIKKQCTVPRACASGKLVTGDCCSALRLCFGTWKVLFSASTKFACGAPSVVAPRWIRASALCVENSSVGRTASRAFTASFSSPFRRLEKVKPKRPATWHLPLPRRRREKQQPVRQQSLDLHLL